jgi:hypothetical protein
MIMNSRYPTISKSDLYPVASRLLRGESIDWDNETIVVWQGSGSPIGLEDFDALCQTFDEELAEHRQSLKGKDQRHDVLEGKISGRLHHELSKLSVQILDDPGFWRYLALKNFWNYILWRHSETFEEGNPAKYGVYIDGTDAEEAIPVRLYIRGHIALDGGIYDLASSDTDADGDFWRSHITRVRTWIYPSLARALVKSHKTKRMTNELREFAKRMTRRRASLVLTAYDDADAAALIRELREEG